MCNTFSVGSLIKLARMVVVSTVIALVLTLVNATLAVGHELRPAVADVQIGQDQVELQIELALEALVAKIDVSEIDDTDNAPNAARYDELRAMEPAALEEQLRADWDALSGNFLIAAGDDPATNLTLTEVIIPEVGDVAIVRESKLTLTATLPQNGENVTVGWTNNNGPLVIRQIDAGEDAYAALLDGGQLSVALPRTGYASEGAFTVFTRFIVQGFEHIIPKGADHIVFVLGLFFFSLKMRPLLVQVTSFTVAHTVTLALAALGFVTISPSIVEPLIAASIVFVAVENILRPQLGVWRTAVVFVFGLLHGLGFASVLGELGGGQANFVARLIGFNIGVEIGQLAVIAVAFLLVGLTMGSQPWYRARVAIPASLIIALIGVHWFMDRVFDLGFLPVL